MNETWQIREATAQDAVCLGSCMASAYAPYLQRMNGIRLPPMDVDYCYEIANYPVWVVESKGKILGGLIMMFENEKASIANIAIDPEFQGQGIGSALLKFAESKAIEREYSELHLATHVLLVENIALYRHLCWREHDRDGSRVFMKKKI